MNRYALDPRHSELVLAEARHPPQRYSSPRSRFVGPLMVWSMRLSTTFEFVHKASGVLPRREQNHATKRPRTWRGLFVLLDVSSLAIRRERPTISTSALERASLRIDARREATGGAFDARMRYDFVSIANDGLVAHAAEGKGIEYLAFRRTKRDRVAAIV